MNNDEFYLIAHKVRGEPAFDIAQKIMLGNEEGWIIPTSGHRAYPYWSAVLGEIECSRLWDVPPMPPDTPDHYDSKRDDGSHLVNQAREILMRKGLISQAKPAQSTFRRA